MYENKVKEEEEEEEGFWRIIEGGEEASQVNRDEE